MGASSARSAAIRALSPGGSHIGGCLMTRLSNHVRGVLKTFGLLPDVMRGLSFGRRVEALLVGRDGLAPVVRPMLAAWRQLREQGAALDKEVRALAKKDPACRLLMRGAPHDRCFRRGAAHDPRGSPFGHPRRAGRRWPPRRGPPGRRGVPGRLSPGTRRLPVDGCRDARLGRAGRAATAGSGRAPPAGYR